MSELRDWFETWWQTLPKELFTSQSKGSKAEAWIQLEKLQPDKELQDKIMWFTRERMLRDRKRRRQDIKIAPWKHAVRLIRHRFWEDELPDTRPDQNQAELTKCACGQPTNIGRLCWSCHDAKYPVDYSLQKAALRNAGLTKKEGETRQEWNLRCKEYCLTKGGLGRLIGSGKTGNSPAC